MYENETVTVNADLLFKNEEMRTYVVGSSTIMMISEETQLPEVIVVHDYSTNSNYEFLYKWVDASADGKVIHWHYLPSKESMNTNPEICGYGLKVYND